MTIDLSIVIYHLRFHLFHIVQVLVHEYCYWKTFQTYPGKFNNTR